MRLCWTVVPLFLALAAGALPGRPPAAASLRFEVTVADGLLSRPANGRVLVVLGKETRPEPRHLIGPTEPDSAPFLGQDADGFAPGQVVRLDRSSASFPLADLGKLRRGEYAVQAVFDHSRDLRFPAAPGNLVSEPRRVTLDPGNGDVVRLELTRKLSGEGPPEDTAELKFVKLRSEKLSRFHGRAIYLRAGVILPPGHARDTGRRYPLRVHVGGFGTRYTAVRELMATHSAFRKAWYAPGAPRMILLHLDGAGPLGDPYQVNSANHGPYGDAVTQELIPHVEKRFRGIGEPWARVLDGASTGGWVSLALQVFYPEFFNGAWSHCPDPVDFRAFELLDVYRDDNAYLNRHGFERASARTRDGDTLYTMRYDVQKESVLGRGGRWTLSGKDWASWNATFGPRGKDGLPVPLWDGQTGKINRDVLGHWRKYDLRLHLEANWEKLGPKLHGKLRIWVGDADDYFLNNAVHLLDEFLSKARPAFGGSIRFGRRGGHGWRGLTETEMMEQMAKAVEMGRTGR